MVLESLFGKKEEKKTIEVPQDVEITKLALDDSEVKIAYYKKIIEKYAAMIDEYEEKTVPELKSLINKNDPAIQELRKKITDEFMEEKMKRGADSTYEYSKDFLFISDRVFSYCKKLKRINANLPVSFWLSPKEIIEMQAADPFDRSILLCSLLRGFDATAKIRILELENSIIHPIVTMEFENRFFALDPSQKESSITTYSGQTLQDALMPFAFEGNRHLKSAYEFNDDEYTEF